MMPEKVDQMLKDYRECKGRCEHLRTEIELLDRQSVSLRRTMIEDAVSVSATVSDMPRGTALSDQTANVALRFADGKVPDYIKEIEADADKLRKELSEKDMVVIFVEAWLKGLTEKERWIIEKQVIDGAYWREIIHDYRDRYGDEYTKDGLKRIRNVAMTKIYRIAA